MSIWTDVGYSARAVASEIYTNKQSTVVSGLVN